MPAASVFHVGIVRVSTSLFALIPHYFQMESKLPCPNIFHLDFKSWWNVAWTYAWLQHWSDCPSDNWFRWRQLARALESNAQEWFCLWRSTTSIIVLVHTSVYAFKSLSAASWCWCCPTESVRRLDGYLAELIRVWFTIKPHWTLHDGMWKRNYYIAETCEGFTLLLLYALTLTGHHQY